MKITLMRGLPVWLLVSLLHGPNVLPAQEVIVGDPVVFAGEVAADQPPVLKRKPSLVFPRDMKPAGTVGYVMMIFYLDEKGKTRSRWVHGTVHPYEKAVADGVDEWRFQPGARDGQPVGTRFWQPVIFNPASSAANLPDATPRLLHITPVFTDDKDAKEAVVVPVTLTVGEDGRPTGLVVAPGYAARERVIAAAMPAWKFSPARKDGNPRAATMELAVVVQQPLPPAVTKGTPPVPVRQVAPVYPAAMIDSGLRGAVAVEFVIDKEGVVTGARVLESNNPGFNEAALEAVRKWKFKPARTEGKPVEAKMRQLIEFQMNYGGSDAFTVEKAKKKKGAEPGAYEPDVSPKPRGVVLPVYPHGLLRSRTKGSAEIRMIITEKGRVYEVAVVKSTHPEFGLALAAAVQAYVFDPALKQGKAIPSSLTMTHEFNPSEMVADEAEDLLDREQRKPGDIVVPASLAEVPRAISQTGPAYPPEFARTGEAGRAVVEFLIDREGRVRLPRIVSATQPAFGYAAVQAVSAWRFAEPRIGGKPAVLRLQMPMEFNPAGK